jgi:hypothetical protein
MHNVNNRTDLINVVGDVLKAFTYATCFYVIYAFSFLQVQGKKLHKVLKARLPYYNKVVEKTSNMITSAFISPKWTNNKAVHDTFNGGEYRICIEWVNKDNTLGNFKYNPDLYSCKEEILRELNQHMGIDSNEYDNLFIYNVRTESGVCDKLVVRDLEAVEWDNTLVVYTKTTPFFMSIQVIFENDPTKTAHTIVLQMGENNYYVSGNVINYDFIMYYCAHVLRIEHAKPDTTPIRYTVTLVDNNIKVFTICEKDEIVFSEGDYVVKTHQQPVHNEEIQTIIQECVEEVKQMAEEVKQMAEEMKQMSEEVKQIAEEEHEEAPDVQQVVVEEEPTQREEQIKEDNCELVD